MINGKEAQPGMFTFMAALTWYASAAGMKSECSGFVVSPTAIMAASHCLHVSKSSDTLLEANYTARLGTLNRKEGRMVQLKAFPHPRYNRKTKRNDIAILKPYNEGEQLPLGNDVQPIALAGSADVVPEKVLAMGWGKTDFDDCVENFGHPSLTLLYNEQTITKVLNRKKQFQVEGGSSSTCMGDSGSPLVEDRNGKYVAVGILSQGDHYGNEVYQQIAPHKDFIQQFAPDATFV